MTGSLERYVDRAPQLTKGKEGKNVYDLWNIYLVKKKSELVSSKFVLMLIDDVVFDINNIDRHVLYHQYSFNSVNK